VQDHFPRNFLLALGVYLMVVHPHSCMMLVMARPKLTTSTVCTTRLSCEMVTEHLPLGSEGRVLMMSVRFMCILYHYLVGYANLFLNFFTLGIQCLLSLSLSLGSSRGQYLPPRKVMNSPLAPALCHLSQFF